MGSRKKILLGGQVLATLALLVLLSSSLYGEQLPTKTYTTADGLVSNKISRIVRDRRGFLWFCTEDGLSRFDGYRFTNYTRQQGLPANWVDDFLETQEGYFLVATSAGLCIFDPKGIPRPQDQLVNQPNAKPMFTVYRPDADGRAATIKVLYEDPAGRIWCGTRRGLYQIDISNRQVIFHPIELNIRSENPEDYRIRGIITDQDGLLWVITQRSIFHLFADGRNELLSNKGQLPDQDLMSLARHSESGVWVGTRLGLWEISQLTSPVNAIATGHYATNAGLPCIAVNALYTGQDGRLWVGAE